MTLEEHESLCAALEMVEHKIKAMMFKAHDAEQRAEIERLQARLAESEAAYDDAARTIEALLAQLATAKREVWDAVTERAQQAENDGADPIWMLEWCRQEAQRVKAGGK